MFVVTISNYQVIKANPPQLMPYHKDTSDVICDDEVYITLIRGCKRRLQMFTHKKRRIQDRPKNYNEPSVPQAFVTVSGLLLFPFIVFLLPNLTQVCVSVFYISFNILQCILCICTGVNVIVSNELTNFVTDVRY